MVARVLWDDFFWRWFSEADGFVARSRPLVEKCLRRSFGDSVGLSRVNCGIYGTQFCSQLVSYIFLST